MNRLESVSYSMYRLNKFLLKIHKFKKIKFEYFQASQVTATFQQLQLPM